MDNNARVAIVTGANSGVGLEVARHLGSSGYSVVILACRSIERAEQAIQSSLRTEVAGLTSAAHFVAMKLDLSDYSSVREFANNFQSSYNRLDALVNNAGLAFSNSDTQRHVNTKGHEITIATNHLGHFLLTQLLLPLLKATAAAHGGSSITNVSSDIHLQVNGLFGFGALDFDDPMLERPGAYKSTQAYKNSKTMNVLHARRLARDLKGSGVRANSAHPGLLPTTGFFREYSACLRCFLTCCFHGLCCCCRVARSAEEAGRHIAAVADGQLPHLKGTTGLYFYDARPKTPSAEASLQENEDLLWQWSERVIAE